MAIAFPDNSRQTGAALEETYRFLLWLMPTIDGSYARYMSKSSSSGINFCLSEIVALE